MFIHTTGTESIMTTFYTCENNQINWNPMKAKTLAGAKRAAIKRQMFAESIVRVGESVNGETINEVCYKDTCEFNCNSGVWIDVAAC